MPPANFQAAYGRLFASKENTMTDFTDTWLASALQTNPTNQFTLDDIATIEGDWTDDADEPSFAAYGTLTDGRWWAAEGWCDYTGWGCQDDADYYVGPTREDVIANGLTNDARSALGLVIA